MVILSSYHPRAAPRILVPITRWPFVFAKWRLRHASNSSTLPPFAALPSHGRFHPSRASTSLYPAKVGENLLVSSPSCFIPFQDFSPSAAARTTIFVSSTTPPPAPSLDHPDLPFLSLDHSDRFQNKCYPHLPRFPFPRGLRLWLFCGLLSTARDGGEGYWLSLRSSIYGRSIHLLDLDPTPLLY